jgi:hypothetical protein
MNLTDWASRHQLRRPRRDACGDLNILGKRGDIYEYGQGLLAATILHAPNAQHWNKYREAAKAAGCRVTQNGDEEGTFLFDPGNEIQVNLSLEAIRAFRKRKVSPAVLQALEKARVKGASFALKTHSGASDGVIAVLT